MLVNRLEPDAGLPARFLNNAPDVLSGWHPTRPLFEKMLKFGGFDNIIPLTDVNVNFPNVPLKNITNSAYYKATKARSVSPYSSRTKYIPR